jgi:hypothetical protein
MTDVGVSKNGEARAFQEGSELSSSAGKMSHGLAARIACRLPCSTDSTSGWRLRSQDLTPIRELRLGKHARAVASKPRPAVAVAGDGRGHLPAGWQMLVTGDTATACFAMKRVDLDAAPTLPYHLPGSEMSCVAIQVL